MGDVNGVLLRAAVVDAFREIVSELAGEFVGDMVVAGAMVVVVFRDKVVEASDVIVVEGDFEFELCIVFVEAAEVVAGGEALPER